MKIRIDCLIVHNISGRVRYRVSHKSALRNHSRRLRAFVLGRSGIAGVRFNERCGSVIVDYDPSSLTAQSLSAELAQFLGDLVADAAGSPVDRRQAGCGQRQVAQGVLVAGGTRQVSGQSVLAGRLGRPVAEAVGESDAEPETASDADWYRREIEEVLEAFGGNSDQGLQSSNAAQRFIRVGPNSLGEIQPRSRWTALSNQVATLPVALLLGSAVVSVVTAGMVDAVVILGVVAVNTCIGYVTESQAERTIASLHDQPDGPATVVRDGQRMQVEPERIVPGDIVVLLPGMTVPADLRLIVAQRLMIDESTLTGESMPVAKSPDALGVDRAIGAGKVPLRDRANMAYRGTIVTGGSGTGIAVATGSETEVGHIQMLVGSARPPETPVQRQLGQLGTQLGLLTGVICGGIFAVGLFRRYGTIEMLKTATSLAVAAVPEGLPMVATTTLALGVGRMRCLNVAVRRLDAVETLGSVEVFCFDKTGTLTLNQMRVVRIHAGGETIEAREDRPLVDLDGQDREQDTSLRSLLEVSALCNETEIRENDGSTFLEGSPTETALVRMTLDAGIDVEALRRSSRLLRTEYRTESRGYMTTVHETDSGDRLWAVKGRPADVLELCRSHHLRGDDVPLTREDRLAIGAENERMAAMSLRVLGIAFARAPSGDTSRTPLLTWLGLVGIADPIRPGMRGLLETFHDAGIRTIMITGDQSVTATAIGRDLRLSGTPELRTIDSSELESIAPDVLKSLAENVHVFSSVTPSHKLAIVQALQRSGCVVAMTGDGINDGPALKAADIGVAMGGEGGTDVARMTADVVLEDNNLESMVTAITQGRAIYGNTRNAILYLLSTNISEIMVMGCAVAAGVGAPLNPLQLLWINLVSDIFPVLALAIQPPEPGILRRAPRAASEPFIDRVDLQRVMVQSSMISGGTFASYAWGRMRHGSGPPAATMAFTTITVAQFLHMLSCRSDQQSVFCAGRAPLNTELKLGLAAGLGLQSLTIAFGPLRRLLRNTTLSPLDFAVSMLGAGVPFLMNEAIKHTRNIHSSTTLELDDSGDSR